MSVYKVIELVGESSIGWQEAVEDAVQRAAKTVEGINGVELVNMTAKVDNWPHRGLESQCQSRL